MIGLPLIISVCCFYCPHMLSIVHSNGRFLSTADIYVSWCFSSSQAWIHNHNYEGVIDNALHIIFQTEHLSLREMYPFCRISRAALVPALKDHPLRITAGHIDGYWPDLNWSSAPVQWRVCRGTAEQCICKASDSVSWIYNVYAVQFITAEHIHRLWYVVYS